MANREEESASGAPLPKAPARERPILMSGPMVRAILEGRKTQTRRIVEVQPDPDDVHAPYPVADSHITFLDVVEKPEYYACTGLCPHGGPGDHLWVKETWSLARRSDDGEFCSSIKRRGKASFESFLRDGYAVEYAADGERPAKAYRIPSIFMPRSFSRLTLEITEVRVERLQEIRPQDYEAEGCTTGYSMCELNARYDSLARQFRDLWDSLNAKRGYGWDVNPWVWVIDFKAVRS